MTDSMVEQIEQMPSDVADMKLDLTPETKLRTVALMMGIRYYTDTIIKDAEYLKLMMDREKEARFSNDPDQAALWHLRPASVNGVLNCAIQFEQFLSGNMSGARMMIGGEEMPNPADTDRAQGTTQSGE